MSIITEILDLITSEIIITHIHFIMGFHKSFSKKYYDILKSVGNVTKTTGHMSRKIAVEVFNTHTDIQRLKVTVEINEHFQSCYEKNNV